MPVLQGGNPTGDIIGGLLGAAGQYLAARQEGRAAKQKRQDTLNQQAIQNALAQGNLNINAANAGGSVDPKTGAFTQDPRLAGALAGLAGGDTGTTGLLGRWRARGPRWRRSAAACGSRHPQDDEPAGLRDCSARSVHASG
jgi:hypothetical protein